MPTTPPPVNPTTQHELVMSLPPAYRVEFNDAAGHPVFTIYLDKPRVVLAPGVSWDAASREFWRNVKSVTPVCPGPKP